MIDDSDDCCEENELRKREGHEEAEDEDTIGLSNIQLYSKLKQVSKAQHATQLKMGKLCHNSFIGNFSRYTNVYFIVFQNASFLS